MLNTSKSNTSAHTWQWPKTWLAHVSPAPLCARPAPTRACADASHWSAYDALADWSPTVREGVALSFQESLAHRLRRGGGIGRTEHTECNTQRAHRERDGVTDMEEGG